jgi:hypothetical protein
VRGELRGEEDSVTRSSVQKLLARYFSGVVVVKEEELYVATG